MISPSPVHDLAPQEYNWLRYGRTFCLRTQGGRKYASTGGDWWECKVHPPLNENSAISGTVLPKPLVRVGEDHDRFRLPYEPPAPPEVFDPKTADYSPSCNRPRRDWWDVLLTVALLSASLGLVVAAVVGIVRGVWR